MRDFLREILFLTIEICLVGLVGCAAGNLKVSILTPDGKPARGAQAVLAPPGDSVQVIDGQSFDDDPAYQRFTADENGRIRFHATTQPSLVVAIHSSGYAQVNGEAISGAVHLKPWGAIEGRLVKGNKPDGGENVSAWTNAANQPDAIYETNVKTDRDGKFVMARVPAGKVNVAPAHQFSWGALVRPLKLIQVESGKTTAVVLGGTGRPVVGKISFPQTLAGRTDLQFSLCMIGAKKDSLEPTMPDDIAHSSLKEQAKWWDAFEKTADAKTLADAQKKQLEKVWTTMHGFEVEPDGSFRIEDVTAGTYTIDFDVLQKAGADRPRKRLGYGQGEFTVPAMPGDCSDEPLNIASVETKMFDEIEVGDVAPDFVVKTLDDRTLRLSDFRGKVVLVDFWATWCGPCLGNTEILKQIYRTFGSDSRFAMIGLSQDPKPNAPIRYIAQHEMKWHQGFLGNADGEAVAQAYHIEGIPAFFLIGPDEKLLAKPKWDGEDLKEKIERALGR
jgi:peroxiredoxin